MATAINAVTDTTMKGSFYKRVALVNNAVSPEAYAAIKSGGVTIPSGTTYLLVDEDLAEFVFGNGGTFAEATVIEAGSGGEPTEITSEDISDSTELGRDLLTASSAANARSAISAGTSNLEIGATGSTAAAGNHSHTFSSLSGSVSGATGANLQEILEWIVGELGV